MRKILPVLLLACPLAAAAQWSYDGKSADGTAAAGEPMQKTSASESGTEDAAMSMARSPLPPPANAPSNNTTMAKVRQANGEPETIIDAVGDPPITRWQYPDYVVYFEHDRVLISVGGRW